MCFGRHADSARPRAGRVAVEGNREYNNGWHIALDLPNLLTVSEAITRAALEREESRAAHFRDDRPSKSVEFGKFNIAEGAGCGSVFTTRFPGCYASFNLETQGGPTRHPL